jgi:hypothetical protein
MIRGIAFALSVCSFAATAVAAPQEIFHAPRVHLDAIGCEFRSQADVDGDGDVDLVSLKTFPAAQKGYRVFLNDGAGTVVSLPFQAFPGPPSNDEHVGELPLRIGDVTNDGIPDLVVDRTVLPFPWLPPAGIYVLAGTGNGTFAAPILIPGYPSAFVLGQADSDAGLEIAAVTDGSTLRWHDFAAGTFQPGPAHVLPGGAFDFARFAAVDFDGDGDDDLVGTDFGSTQLRVMRSDAGTFVAGPIFAVPSPFRAPETALIPGDADGDGDQDVLLVLPSFLSEDGSVAILPFAAVPGGFVVQAAVHVDVPDVALAGGGTSTLIDWDLDGTLDLWTGGATLLRGLGGFQFTFGSQLTLGDVDPGAAGPADLDGDGRLDAIGAFTTLPGNASFESHQVGPADVAFTIGLTNRTAEDADDDGDLDLVGAGGAGIDLNDGAGSFHPSGPRLPPLPASFGFGPPIAHGDLSGDGRTDWLFNVFLAQPFPQSAIDFGTFLLIETAAGSLEIAGNAAPPGSGLGTSSVGAPVPGRDWPLADVDGDGDLDILALDGFHPNDGSNSFAAKIPAYSGSPLGVADIDGDGDVDLLLENVTAPFTLTLARQAAGGFTSEILVAASSRALAARFLDLDGDGDLDVVAGEQQQGNEPQDMITHVFENQSGVLFPRPALLGTFGAGPTVAVADVDGDTRLDLLLSRRISALSTQTALVVHRGLGGFAYAEPELYLVPELTALMDADGDGDVDALGRYAIDGLRFGGPSAGGAAQYGAGSTGAGGAVPLLGAKGPFATGTPEATIRVRRLLAGAPAFLLLSLAKGSFGGVPAPGVTLLVAPPLFVLPLPLAPGPAGTPGEGGYDIPIVTNGSLAGVRVFLQVYGSAPLEPGGVASSNGLELLHGN